MKQQNTGCRVLYRIVSHLSCLPCRHVISAYFSVSHDAHDSTAYCHNATMYWYFLPNVTLHRIGATSHVHSGTAHVQQISATVARFVVSPYSLNNHGKMLAS